MGSASGRTASRSSSLSHSTRPSSAHVGFSESPKPSSPIIPKMKSSQSLHAMAHSLHHLSTPWSNRHQQKQNVKPLSREMRGIKLSLPVRTSSFRKSLSKEPQPLLQPRFCFSSSGKSLFFWDKDSSCVTRFDLSVDGSKPQSHRYDVSGVQCVTAGEQHCAIVAAVGQVI